MGVLTTHVGSLPRTQKVVDFIFARENEQDFAQADFDVAMTEASVGAGISTVLVLGALYLTKVEEAPPRYSAVLPGSVALATGAMLIYGTYDLPPFGVAAQPVNTHVGATYLANNMAETDIPNAVTAVLASYRGFDTLGEVTVIFTAGIGVLLLLKRWGQT